MKFEKLKLIILATVLLSISQIASARVVNNGDQFDYMQGQAVFFDMELSVVNPTITFGVNVLPGEALDITVTAPAGLDLQAILTTAPDGAGTTIATPNPQNLVPAGTEVTFPVNGNVFDGQTKWFTVSVGGIPNAPDYLAALPGGVLLIGDFLSSPEQGFEFWRGPSDPGNGSGGDPTPVPVSSTLPLTLLGLTLIVLFWKRARREDNMR